MKTEIIVMLTHNDVTVADARAVFASAKHLPVQYWGFKDVGLSVEESEALVADFRAAGKTPVLEAVSFSEEEMLEAVSFAAKVGVEYFTGGAYSEAVAEKVREAGMKYYPFCGDISGPPISLAGTLDDVRADAARLLAAGTDGVDLVAYRYTDGDPIELVRRVVAEIGGERVVVAGSINSVERIRLMHEVGPRAFTIGGALFESTLRPGGTFAENLQAVIDAGETEAVR